MKKKYPKPINKDDFKGSTKDPKIFYGLNKDIKFCKTCAMSNQKPISTTEFKNNLTLKKIGINISEDGICDPCKVNIIKNEKIDWSHRDKELKDLCDQFRKNDGSYDCIVPGSGGKDSFYASHILKTKYKMNPLTVTWSPTLATDWGLKNFHSWIASGQDNILISGNGLVKRLLTRLALENLFHPFQPFILGQRIAPVKIALEKNIKLIFYGENEAEINNPIADFQKPTRDKDTWAALKNNINKILLSGEKLEDLINNYGITKNELSDYIPIEEEKVLENKLQVQYLGYYLKWDCQSKYYYAREHSDFIPSPERTSGTYSKYNSIDDKMDDFHFFTTLIKFGIGRVNYDVSRELRDKDITIEEAKELVKKYQYEFPSRFEKELFEYLSIPKNKFPIASEMFEQPIMNREYFDLLTDTFRSPHIWYYTDNEKWLLRKTFY